MKTLKVTALPLCLMLLVGCSGATHSFRVTSSSFGVDETLGGSGELPGSPMGDEYETFSVVAEEGSVTVTGGEFTLSHSRLTLYGRDLESGEEPHSMLITFTNRIDASIDHAVSYSIRGFPGPGGGPFLDFEINGTQAELPETGLISQLQNSEGQFVAFSGSDPHTVSIQMNFLTKQAIFTLIQSDFDDSISFALPDTFGVKRSLSIMNFENDTLVHVDTPVGVYFD